MLERSPLLPVLPITEDNDVHTHPTLATRFARNTHVFRSETPIDEERMRFVAPSIFATGKNAIRFPPAEIHINPVILVGLFGSYL